MKKNKTTNYCIALEDYGTRLHRLDVSEKKQVRDYVTVGLIATLFFVAVDCTKLFITWDTVQTDSWYFIFVLALASAVILDVPMMLAGNTIKEYIQQLKSKREMLTIAIPSVGAFLLFWGISTWFSLVTRDATFHEAASAGAATNLSNAIASANAAIIQEGNPVSVFVAALYAGFLPFGTSICSLVISLASYDPLHKKILKTKTARILVEEHLIALREGMEQEKSLENRLELQLAREDDSYHQFVEECHAQGAIRIQAFNEAIKEHVDADSINRIALQSQAEMDAVPFSEEPFGQTSDTVVATNSISSNF